MTHKIGHPFNPPLTARPAPAPLQQAGPLEQCGEFAAELRRHGRQREASGLTGVRGEPVPHPSSAAEEDFLGECPDGGGVSGAKIFNADGFFARLEAVLGERSAAPPNCPAEIPPGLAEVPLPPFPGQLPEGTGQDSDDAPGIRQPIGHYARPGLALQLGAMRLRPWPLAARTAPAPAAAPPAELLPESLGPSSVPSRAKGEGASPAFRLWLEGGEVHVAAPLGALSQEDEAELLERVADLLSSHGALHSGLSINGQQFVLPRQRIK